MSGYQIPEAVVLFKSVSSNSSGIELGKDPIAIQMSEIRQRPWVHTAGRVNGFHGFRLRNRNPRHRTAFDILLSSGRFVLHMSTRRSRLQTRDTAKDIILGLAWVIFFCYCTTCVFWAFVWEWPPSEPVHIVTQMLWLIEILWSSHDFALLQKYT